MIKSFVGKRQEEVTLKEKLSLWTAFASSVFLQEWTITQHSTLQDCDHTHFIPTDYCLPVGQIAKEFL